MTITLIKPCTKLIWRSATAGNKFTTIPGPSADNDGYTLDIITTLGSEDTHTVTPLSGTIGGGVNYSFEDGPCSLSLVSDFENNDWIIRCLNCHEIATEPERVSAGAYFPGTAGAFLSLGGVNPNWPLDSNLFTVSFWIRVDSLPIGLDTWTLSAFGGGVVSFLLLPGGAIRFFVSDTTNRISVTTTNNFIAPADTYYHILYSVNTTTGVVQIYINDVVTTFTTTFNDSPFVINFSFGGPSHTPWGFFGSPLGQRYIGDVAEAWFAAGQYLDFSIEANRRKFISATGCFEDLEDDGSTPTGTSPSFYFHGDAIPTDPSHATFTDNAGTVGGDGGVSLSNAIIPLTCVEPITDITLDNSIFTGTLGRDTLVGQVRVVPDTVSVTWSVSGTDSAYFKIVTGSNWQKTNRTDPTLQTQGVVAGDDGGFSISITATPTVSGMPFTKAFTLTVPPAPTLQGTVHHISPPSSSAGIQAVINAASSGDTIYFDPGTFTITTNIIMKSGLLMIGGLGANAATIQGSASSLILFTEFPSGNISNCTFYGLRFQRAGINCSTITDGVIIKNCYFTTENYSGGDNQNCPIFAINPSNCSVTWCTFENCIGGVKWYYPDNVSVSRNKFVNVYQCHGLSPGPVDNQSNNITAQYNYMTGVQRMGFEWHPEGGAGYLNNFVCSDNYLLNYGTPLTNDFGAFGLSIVPSFGVGQISRNFIKPGDNLDTWFPTGTCHSDPGDICHGFSIEVYSSDVITMSDNYLNGLGIDPDFLPDAAIYGAYDDSGAYVITNNNTYKNNDAYGSGGGTQINAGASATVSGTTHDNLGTPAPFAAGSL